MKKLSIFFLMSIICHDACSQAKLKTQCKFGFNLGVGMQTISGCPVKTKPRIAYMAGMWVQIKMSKSWTMLAELNRIDKGTGGGHQYQGKYGDYWLRLAYLEIPILFQYNKKEVYFEFGPGLAALIGSGEYTKGVAFPNQDLYPFSKKEFSFNLGTGYRFKEKWRAGLRLSYSLLPVRKQLLETSHQGYNRGIVFSLSRQISLKASRTKQSEGTE